MALLVFFQIMYLYVRACVCVCHCMCMGFEVVVKERGYVTREGVQRFSYEVLQEMNGSPKSTILPLRTF